MKKQILLIGEKYSNNLGDGLICEIAENILQDSKLEIINFDISGRNEYSNVVNEFDLKRENLLYIKSKVKEVLSFIGYNKTGKNFQNIYDKFKKNFDNIILEKKIDTVIFAGGQMFIDTFIYQINYICQYCEINNIDVLFNCCGGGKILNKSLLEETLKLDSIKYISVRDNYEKIEKISKKNVINCYDSVILLSELYKVKKQSKFEYGVGIMFSTLQSPKRQINFWKQMIQTLVDNNIEFKIFTNGSYKDYSFAEFILNELNIDKKIYLMERPKKPIELVNIVLKFDKILSMRLHSMIIAYSYDIPSVSISWDKKINVFFRKIGLNNNCYTLKDKQDKILKHLISLDCNCIDETIKKEICSKIHRNFRYIKKYIAS